MKQPQISACSNSSSPTQQPTRVGKHAQVVHRAGAARHDEVGQAVVGLAAVLLRLLPQAVEAGHHLRGRRQQEGFALVGFDRQQQLDCTTQFQQTSCDVVRTAEACCLQGVQLALDRASA